VNKPVIGWIGTGIMGRWMCQHIMPLASATYVYNRTASKTEPLVAQGAVACDSVKELVPHCDLVFTMVGHPSDVKEVYFGDQGALANAKEGTIFVDMTTTEPSLAIEIYHQAQQKGCFSLDAPVSGGDVGAKEARLSIMSGGDKAISDQVEPFFAAMGKEYKLQGKAGAGQHTKMCNQIMIAGTMIGMCESLLYGKRAGLDGPTLVQTIAKGAAQCWALDNLAPRVLQDNFNPGFMIDHFVKDMGIALLEAKKMNLALPGLALVEQLYIAIQGAGGGQLGTQALLMGLERLNSSQSFT